MNLLTRWKNRISRNGNAVHIPPAENAETAHKVRATRPGLSRAFPAEFEVSASLLSDRGCLRTTNEDRWHYVKPDAADVRARKGILALVADGMGGHAAGEVASEMAVSTISRAYFESEAPPEAALAAAFHAANRAIYEASHKQPRLNGMGTTCTALVIHEGLAFSAQVGDSRLYLVRGDEIYLMSEDHSAVMEMVRCGLMTLDDARHHADKNILLRALGTQPKVNVAKWQSPFPVLEGDCFVLCSDGLYDLVADEEIKRVVTEHAPHACECLLALAKERGGHDNITVGVLRLESKRLTEA